MSFSIHNFEFLLKRKDGSTVWTLCNITLLRTKEGEIVGTQAALRDISARKKAQEDLQRIEWLLTHSVTPTDAPESAYQPPYGDVTELNTCRIILDSVGKDTLKQIAQDTIDLLETSVAVYEKNGDYAFGMFSSGWCQVFDLASRRLCGDLENQAALTCGKWLCHAHCWNDSAKAAINAGQPTDIACIGGIRLYAVPIVAGDEIVGAINIGYGDPPADEPTLLELAERFDLEIEDIRKAARAYRSRPSYIIELAKKRLHTTAKLIGEIVTRKRTEATFIEREAQYRRLFEHSTSLIMEVDADTFEIVSCNPAMARALKTAPEHVVGKKINAFLPEQVLEKRRVYGEKALNDNAIQTFEDERNGRYFLNNFIPVLSQGKRYVQTITYDITERKHAEEALKQSEEKYRALFENMVDEVHLWEVVRDKNSTIHNWRLVDANPAALKA